MVTPRATLRHVPALDGLRGLALLGVLLFHANGALPGGYLGVDLFFVLSGYLITSLLLAENERTHRIALSAFWVRRARRLFPALLALMPAIALYGRFFAKPEDLHTIRAEALATLGYVANWRTIWSHGSYWDLFASPSPLEHTWSLSIEEQFYVVWPLLVVLVLRRQGRRALLVVTLGLIVLSMAATLLLYDPQRTTRVYLGTDTRAAGILAGAALACALPRDAAADARTTRALDVLGVAASLGLAYAWCTLRGDNPFLYHGGLWLTELATLTVILSATWGGSGVVARVLSLRPLTLLGTISYGAYLWHWPVNVLLTPMRLHLRGFWLHVVHLSVTLAISIASYHLIEKPVRTRGVPFGKPLFVVPAAALLAVLLVVRATYARPVAARPLPPPVPIVAADVAKEPPPPPFHVIMFGDSTANSLGWGLRGLQRVELAVDLKGLDGCTLLGDGCGGPTWAKDMEDGHPDATLVMVAGAFMHGMDVDGAWKMACNPKWELRFRNNLVRHLEEMKRLDGQVWVVTVPYPLGPWDEPGTHGQVDCINASLRTAVGTVPEVRILELAEHLCPKGECALEFEGNEIRPDGVHYSIEGARGVARWTLEQLEL